MPERSRSLLCLLALVAATLEFSARTWVQPTPGRGPPKLLRLPRRDAILSGTAAAGAGLLLPDQASAAERSRVDGYEFQLTEQEWRERFSRLEYFVMREGGTERPGTSTLLKEKRKGVFKCLACDEPLFVSEEKFDSGTGWPSFAARLVGVEEEEKNVMTPWLGQELRCRKCGSHLGDVFDDGMFFPGTRASETGRRYCIDGCALLFYPEDGSEPRRGA
eukprot:CAMPEP_0178423978 /NCGR_PEP_ID=MMETSP0689_2-20121128/27970_1 /TAXON_ID=160604 /ORGANISM="Amphidinium massartii, Strain CS-259" /LENGTH=218 /DNA_ID=CAMNT_0020045595 /DNA_START=46 /DNA_END=702 /DNA_ORIENTATION=-